MLVIPLADEFAQKVLDGEKTSTIRLGRRPYPTGLGVLKTNLKNIPVEIKTTRFCHLNELTEVDAQKDGFDDLQELNQQLRRFYPNIEHSDVVTIVDFRLA